MNIGFSNILLINGEVVVSVKAFQKSVCLYEWNMADNLTVVKKISGRDGLYALDDNKVFKENGFEYTFSDFIKDLKLNYYILEKEGRIKENQEKIKKLLSLDHYRINFMLKGNEDYEKIYVDWVFDV